MLYCLNSHPLASSPLLPCLCCISRCDQWNNVKTIGRNVYHITCVTSAHETNTTGIHSLKNCSIVLLVVKNSQDTFRTSHIHGKLSMSLIHFDSLSLLVNLWKVPTHICSRFIKMYVQHLKPCEHGFHFYVLTLPVCLPEQGCCEAAGRQAVALSRVLKLHSSRGHAGAGQGESTGQRSLRLSWGFHLQHRRTGEGL